MHNLGFKDTIVIEEEFQEAVNLIDIFSYYQILENPTIQSHQTFSTTRDGPVFEITDELNQPYKNHELFENPFGMWKLVLQE